jgi:hypothetical protein
MLFPNLVCLIVSLALQKCTKSGGAVEVAHVVVPAWNQRPPRQNPRQLRLPPGDGGGPSLHATLPGRATPRRHQHGQHPGIVGRSLLSWGLQIFVILEFVMTLSVRPSLGCLTGQVWQPVGRRVRSGGSDSTFSPNFETFRPTIPGRHPDAHPPPEVVAPNPSQSLQVSVLKELLCHSDDVNFCKRSAAGHLPWAYGKGWPWTP